MNMDQTQNGGRIERPPFLLCLGLDYFFFDVFLAAFFAAFLVAICLFSLSIEHRCCNCKVAANEGIVLMKFGVKKNRAVNETFFAPGNTLAATLDRVSRVRFTANTHSGALSPSVLAAQLDSP